MNARPGPAEEGGGGWARAERRGGDISIVWWAQQICIHVGMKGPKTMEIQNQTWMHDIANPHTHKLQRDVCAYVHVRVGKGRGCALCISIFITTFVVFVQTNDNKELFYRTRSSNSMKLSVARLSALSLYVDLTHLYLPHTTFVRNIMTLLTLSGWLTRCPIAQIQFNNEKHRTL